MQQEKNAKTRKLVVDKWAEVFVCNMYINSIYFDEMFSRTINAKMYILAAFHTYIHCVHRHWVFLHTIILGAHEPYNRK